MKFTRQSVLLGASALLMASAATAQQRMQGSGIRISKDGPAPDVSSVSSTPADTTVVVASELNFTTAFDISAYSSLNEKMITFLMATGDSLEIQIGQLAQSKGTDQRVRDFGMMLA